MQKNLDKNLIGNIIIIVSIILVVICIAMIIAVAPLNSSQEDVEWEGLTYIIPPDSQASVTDDSLTVTSQYSTHNIKLVKTKDSSKYKTEIQDDFQNVWKMRFNDTHDFYLNHDSKYGAIVPSDAIDGTNADPYRLKDNTEFIEVTGGDGDYMNSFVSSAFKR